MRKLTALLGFVAALFVVPLFLVASVNAADFRSGQSANVAKGEVIDSTLFIAGQSVEIAGEVNGDLYCAGNVVTVTGTVHGDVICAGQTVNIRGTVDGDVRAAGETVTVEAKVDGNVSAAGSTVTFGAEASARDVHAAGTTVTLNGSVLRDVDAAGETVQINGQVGRNAKTSGEHVALGSKAAVKGNLEYVSQNDVSKADGATVAGTTRHDVPKDSSMNKKDAVAGFFASFQLFVAVTMFVTSVVLVALLPRLFYSLSERGFQQPLLSAVSGLGVSIGGIILVFLLAFTFIGLPLAGITLLAWLLLMILSVPVFSFYLGRALLGRNTDNAFYYMLAGAGIVFVVSLLPVLGGIVLLVAGWLGTGMMVLEAFRRWPSPHYTLKASRKRA